MLQEYFTKKQKEEAQAHIAEGKAYLDYRIVTKKGVIKHIANSSHASFDDIVNQIEASGRQLEQAIAQL